MKPSEFTKLLRDTRAKLQLTALEKRIAYAAFVEGRPRGEILEEGLINRTQLQQLLTKVARAHLRSKEFPTSWRCATICLPRELLHKAEELQVYALQQEQRKLLFNKESKLTGTRIKEAPPTKKAKKKSVGKKMVPRKGNP